MRQIFLYLGFIIFATGSTLFAQITPQSKVVFSEEELVNAVKPAVVRIVEHVEGNASIVPFEINLNDFTIKKIPNEKPLNIPIKLDLTGSGFVVNPDGYILTNSHIVSDYTIKTVVTQPVVDLILSLEEKSLSRNEIEKINKENTDDDAFEFGKKILEFVIEESTFNIIKTITVLNPTSVEQGTAKIAEDGFNAQIVYQNEKWHKDNKDIAVLKIEENNLPSLRLGSSDKIVVGSPVYVFGFPSNAEFNRNSLLEATFTKGVISAIKNSAANDFKIFQTDAKISTGSSGGPLFDREGRVTGLISFITSTLGQENGDSFAFAIPIETAKKPLSDDYIINDEGIFGPHFREGIALFHDYRCKQAIVEFNLAKGVNPKFGVEKYIDVYINQCNELIGSGQSIDSAWDEFFQKISSMGLLVWALSAMGVLVTVMVVIGGLMVLSRLRKNKEELQRLEHVIEHTSDTPVSRMPEKVLQEPHLETVVSSELSQKNDISGEVIKRDSGSTMMEETSKLFPANPDLISYIKKARALGLTYQSIEVELKNVGWSDDDISRAFAVPE